MHWLPVDANTVKNGLFLTCLRRGGGVFKANLVEWKGTEPDAKFSTVLGYPDDLVGVCVCLLVFGD